MLTKLTGKLRPFGDYRDFLLAAATWGIVLALVYWRPFGH